MLAADATGPERVSCVVMPSPHSSVETQADARTIAGNLGCELVEIPIEPMMEDYRRALAPSFDEEGAPSQEEGKAPRDPTRPLESDLGGGNVPAPVLGNRIIGASNPH